MVMTLQQPEAAEWVQDYAYDLAARMTGITSPAGTFSYSYNSGLGGTATASSLISKLALPNGAWISNTYDNNGRMLGTWLTNSVSNIDSSVYTYNVGNQRTALTRTGENTASYGYDPISEVVSDTASEASGGAERYNEQLHYAFDPAGNLTYRTNNTIVKNFQVNNLNELTGMTNGGRLTVMGTTMSVASSVTVNGSNAQIYADATFAATNMPLTTSYTTVASDSRGRHSTNSVTVSVVTNNAAFQYDGNGNLLYDGSSNFAYDDENQLLQVWVAGQWFSQFAYDGKMRRRSRQEFTWQSGAWVQTNEVYYVYDGNVVIQERNLNNLPTTTYTRGLDLAGSLQGAGGIGGLLAMTLNTAPGPSSSNSMYYHSDGNGNVTMLINPSQSIVAKYLYDAFGNVLSAGGTLAQQNLYRFSSKEAHLNSGLVYYLYRYYDPNLQRWPNSDPIGEKGGINLYEFVRNDVINRFDPFGWDYSTTPGIPHISNDRHQNYLIFYISCPKGFKVSNVQAIYDTAALDNGLWLEWESEDEYAGMTGEAQYIQDVNHYLGGGGFGGLQGPPDFTPKVNCAGKPVEEHAYMRSRLVSNGWREQAARTVESLPSDTAETIGLYQEYTRLFYTCSSCCGRGQSQ
jgi:RHS repeat-associated protein